MKKRNWLWVLGLVLVASIGFAADKPAVTVETVKAQADSLQANGNIIWTIIAAFLVFFMQAGFAMVEAGFTRAKNAGNIIMKNLMDFAMGTLAFWIIGFSLMFGVSKAGGFIGAPSLFVGSFYTGGTGAANEWFFAFMIFQTVFAATAATIVSGAMAERTKFKSYLVYSFLLTVVVYPIFGKWAWGSLLLGDSAKGWLEALGFTDFAGSTVVHSVGGWAALAGAIVLGPRIGKFVNGKAKPIPGHNIPLAALGVFILWFGWFGFNPGSTTTFGGSAAVIAVTTNLAAAAGAAGALAVSWMLFGKADVGMSLNGALAGLVAITAGCANVNLWGSVIIGLIAGVIVVFSVLAIDNMKIDDPVGAVSVHGVCGAWGTLAVGLFADPKFAGSDVKGLFFGGGLHQLGIQALGVVVAFVWAFGIGYLIFKLIDVLFGLRVSKKEEVDGLDVHEHGSDAYANFRITHS